jgi:hypothetical protein
VKAGIPVRLVLRIVGAVILRRRLSFQAESRRYLAGWQPPLEVLGTEYMPSCGPQVVTVNHYYRQDFRSWWIAMAISASIPQEVHWVMAAAWTTPQRWKAWWWEPLTTWAFQRTAEVFGFTPMPPMPPKPDQAAWRAQSVRRILRAAKESLAEGGQPIVLGFAPEGSDMPGGVLNLPPPGVGRFLAQMVEMGFWLTPIGIYLKPDGGMCLNFGPAYRPNLATGSGREALDESVRRQVMASIAKLVPEEIKGEFACEGV